MSEYKSQSWRVMADYGCGLWDDRGWGTRPDDEEINAPENFVERFDAWVGTYWDNFEGTLNLDIFDKEGRALAAELKKIVGSAIKVTFRPEKRFGDEYDGPDEEEIL
ncbi:hypothetical protein FACS1894205_0820 [Alphaproteobacteria bacterium]|nr:hypothetical protein FACS1894205_0820 [Alphaproteobacteria bacterium]